MKAALTTFFLLMASIGMAQSTSDFQNTAKGNWKGKGTLFGASASFKMEWDNVLNQNFMKLVFENRFTDPSGVERVMNAHGYYNISSGNGQ